MLAAQAETVEPGGVGESVVLVRNTAEEHDRFDVLVHGPAAAWATVEPASVALNPGDEAFVWVRFRVPATVTGGGSHDYVVTVTSLKDPSSVHAERGELALAPAPAAAVHPDDAMVPPPLGDPAPLFADETPTVAAAPAPRADRAQAAAPSKVPVVEIDENEGTLRRDITRSAVVLGVLLVAAFIVVAAIGEEEPEAPPLVAVAPLATTTTTLDAAGGTAPVAGTQETAPAASVRSSGTTKRVPAPPPADLPPIAFVRWYGPGDRDIVVRGAGRAGGELRLRSPGTVESAPDLSPDGANVAYVQEQGGAWRLCVAPAVGGEATCGPSVDATSSVAWRGEGTGVYAAQNARLIEMQVDSAGVPILGLPEQVHPVAVPGGRFSLSPDGTRIAVVDGDRIAIRPLSGAEGLSLRVPGSPEDPTWASDGERVIYTSNTQLYSTPLGDGPIRQLTADGTVNGDAVVAGGWVVFRSNRSGAGDLYAVSLDSDDGSENGLALVTRASERDTEPAT